MYDFVPGQRCISDAELQLGLGTILTVEQRTVTVLFLATGDTRTYARQTAPLTRVAFSPGDQVNSHDDRKINVEFVVEESGLLTYVGTDEGGNRIELQEGELDVFTELKGPAERLFNGQIDQDKWFEIRYQTLQQLHRLSHSDLYGLIGCRTRLIAHQLYIAHEVATRYAPRVLLADEVGLGKTIEAGLILHQQLLTERARRVLIIVPESLVHQWLVEMLRRFNLHFRIFDEERCQALEQDIGEGNPFQAEQLILCSLGFLAGHPERFQQCGAGEWDLLVVDEAHHLQWSPRETSLEYDIVEQLAGKTKGVLLLTATPEQLGKESHFARLRLLDPDRFPDYTTFVEEEKTYHPIALAVETLLSNEAFNTRDYKTIYETIQEDDTWQLLESLQNKSPDSSEYTQARQALIENLLDRHGTGRVLFRNTRAAVNWFTQRKLSAYSLSLPKPYERYLAALQDAGGSDVQLQLSPELFYEAAAEPDDPHWTQFDPRMQWLVDKLAEIKPNKALVIAASAQTVLDIAKALKTQSGLHAAVFHEGLSIVERDKAAAFFADQENGGQILLCSEIGSEGRNFQFAHQLILFDLPLNPDVLEQRIGRLDRIGQTQTIQIHVPYLESCAQAVLYNWYHEGLNAFEHTCPAGHAVYEKVETALLEALQNKEIDVDPLVRVTREYHQKLNEVLHQGRDRLLEYNSCRPRIANVLKERALEEKHRNTLPGYMEGICDCFGVDIEPQSAGCETLRPGAHMLSSFPGLPEDGMAITYDRETALTNENVHYLTWEHPLVVNAMDMVLSSELGNTAITAIKYPRVTPGTLLLECLYTLESASSDQLQASRYLPVTTIRIVIDENGGDHEIVLPHPVIKKVQTLVDTGTANKIIRAKKQALRILIANNKKLAQAKAPEIRTAAHQHARQTLTKEIDRLKALRQVNINVRSEEIDYFKQQLNAVTEALNSASLRLNALRVMVAM